MLTVRQLSRLAGITPRTLHYYDQIGLLKPTRVGENGYRFYGDEALLRLQQILFYRELEVPLGEIQAILNAREFDAVQALESHKAQLRRRMRHIERLVETVDQTIDHLKGHTQMDKKKMFEVFSEEQQAEYEKEAMQRYDPETVKASNRKWKSYSEAEKQRIGEEGNAIYEAIVAAIDKGPASPEAQDAIERWRRHMAYFWVPNDEQLVGLADLYNDDPRFRANFDRFDPGLAPFMREAVREYVKRRQG